MAPSVRDGEVSLALRFCSLSSEASAGNRVLLIALLQPLLGSWHTTLPLPKLDLFPELFPLPLSLVLLPTHT